MKIILRKSPMILLFFALGALASSVGSAPEAVSSLAPSYLYRATFVRAAPGNLLDLVALYKSRMAVYDAAGDERPLWWRHTEGDQWDLMLLFPMGSYTEYYSIDRIARRAKAAAASPLSDTEFQKKLDACSAWREDIFVLGPPLESVKKSFAGTSYYHIEIFVALPGKQTDLFKEREMENAYQTGLGRPAAMIFVRDRGAAWDLFTLGCYRDLKHWAESADIPKDKRIEAARRAGFKDPDEIGPYMRTLIEMHRDTMGVAIK